MPKLHWSEDTPDKDGLVAFHDPKTDMTVRTFPTATVYFPSGAKVHGVSTTVEERKSR